MSILTERFHYIAPESEILEVLLEQTVLSGEQDPVNPWGGEGAGDEEGPGF